MDEWMNLFAFFFVEFTLLKTKISKKNNLWSSKENSPKNKNKIIACFCVMVSMKLIAKFL